MMMSSTVSISIDSEARSGPGAGRRPAASSVSWRCVVEAGWMIGSGIAEYWRGGEKQVGSYRPLLRPTFVGALDAKG